MLIWRGWGILVAVVAFLGLVLMQLVADALYGSGTYSSQTGRWAPLGLLLAAAILWPLGRRLNGGEKRQLVDPRTGETFEVRREHSLFFIRMEYWAAILAAVALVVFVYSSVRR
jgi:hypothetical protein